jgi:tRNA threonylcarbamoyladenosine biosynthesis protein TsaE
LHLPNHSLIPLPDETATAAFAARFAAMLQAGLVVYLRGDLGAGKTTWVRAMLQALGYTGRVKSPTYTLLECYTAGGFEIRHFDLYRLQDPHEWAAAGFRDEFGQGNICLIEWPEQANNLLPAADIELSFEILPQGRTLTLYAPTHAGKTCLSSL